MKIERMQYQLPVRPAGHRGGHSHHDVDVSDDAVYFEPDERRKKEQQQHESDSENPKQETLEQQLGSEAITVTPDAAALDVPAKEGSKKDFRPALNITA